jgi:uncharacterized membrane protein YozB (DUF420 family)
MNAIRRHAQHGGLLALVWLSGVLTGVLIGLALAAGVLI